MEIPSPRRGLALIFAMGGLAFLLRMAVAWWSVGSTDVFIWASLADNVRAHGLSWTYANLPQFNHPPLMGLYAAFARSVFPDDRHLFSILLKLPGIAGEVLSCILVGHAWSLRRGVREGAIAALVFALNPVGLLVSGFHGNSDCLFAAFSLLSMWAIATRRSFLLAGLAAGAALNVKLIPLVLLAPTFLLCRDWKDASRLLLGLAVCALPFAPFAIEAPATLYRNMLAYNSTLEHWGVSLPLLQAKGVHAWSAQAQALLKSWAAIGRYLVVGSALVLAWWSQRDGRWEPYRVGAIGYACFLFFTPGFGVQYLAALPPLLIAASVRLGGWWTWLAGPFAFGVYFYFYRQNTWPPESHFISAYPMAPSLIGFLAWAFTGVVIWRLVTRARLATA